MQIKHLRDLQTDNKNIKNYFYKKELWLTRKLNDLPVTVVIPMRNV